MIKINKSTQKQFIFAFVAVLVCFLIAVKALSSITTVIFDDIHIVCIDPGHGGEDVGATYNSKTRLEKNDNLTLALRVKDELEALGVKVIMTRETDTYVSLKDRCKTANRGRADLFVSLHRNSSSDGTGIEVWIKDVPSAQEEQLANDILSALSESSELPARGVKKGYRDLTGNNYYINANTNMPSCLVEVGFISNETDNEDFDKNIDAYAQGIAQAVYDNLQ